MLLSCFEGNSLINMNFKTLFFKNSEYLQEYFLKKAVQLIFSPLFCASIMVVFLTLNQQKAAANSSSNCICVAHFGHLISFLLVLFVSGKSSDFLINFIFVTALVARSQRPHCYVSDDQCNGFEDQVTGAENCGIV